MPCNETCPVCGAENKELNLAETSGWFVCEKCGSEVNNLTHGETVEVPLLKTAADIS